MSELHRVIEITQPERLSVREVVAAVAPMAATLAVVVSEDRPVAVLRIGELAGDDDATVIERAREQEPLEELPPGSLAEGAW